MYSIVKFSSFESNPSNFRYRIKLFCSALYSSEAKKFVSIVPDWVNGSVLIQLFSLGRTLQEGRLGSCSLVLALVFLFR